MQDPAALDDREYWDDDESDDFRDYALRKTKVVSAWTKQCSDFWDISQDPAWVSARARARALHRLWVVGEGGAGR